MHTRIVWTIVERSIINHQAHLKKYIIFFSGIIGEAQVQCNLSYCILSSYICDGVADCSNKSDEANCTTLPTLPSILQPSDIPTATPIYTCADLYYACLSGQCIPLSHMCDGEHDCNDTSDEMNCHSNTNPPNVRASTIMHNSVTRVCTG